MTYRDIWSLLAVKILQQVNKLKQVNLECVFRESSTSEDLVSKSIVLNTWYLLSNFESSWLLLLSIFVIEKLRLADLLGGMNDEGSWLSMTFG